MKTSTFDFDALIYDLKKKHFAQKKDDNSFADRIIETVATDIKGWETAYKNQETPQDEAYGQAHDLYLFAVTYLLNMNVVEGMFTPECWKQPGVMQYWTRPRPGNQQNPGSQILETGAPGETPPENYTA